MAESDTTSIQTSDPDEDEEFDKFLDEWLMEQLSDPENFRRLSSRITRLGDGPDESLGATAPRVAGITGATIDTAGLARRGD
ncbi:MAG: hypothetical protein JSR49_11235 [Proteobacteria bacterium]|nr:hypothetical protein [Pseudomonadota bacterium]